MGREPRAAERVTAGERISFLSLRARDTTMPLIIVASQLHRRHRPCAKPHIHPRQQLPHAHIPLTVRTSIPQISCPDVRTSISHYSYSISPYPYFHLPIRNKPLKTLILTWTLMR